MTTANQFQTLLTSLLPQELLKSIACDTQALVRERNFCLWTFVWTLLFGFSSNHRRTLAGFHEIYLLYADKRLSQSAFNQRFSPLMSKLFKRIFQHLLKQQQTTLTPLQGLMADFADILTIDSTIIRLADALQRIFKGVSTPAAIKLNLVYSGKRGLKRFKTAPAIRSEKKLLRVGKWVKDALVLLDKGYYCLDSLQKVDQLGGKFIIPLKDNANPDVTFVASWGDFEEPVGFQMVQGCFSGEDFDAVVQFKQMLVPFRIVGLWHEDDYNWYLTNLDEDYSPREIGVLYRYRWTVELLFKQLKSGHGLNELPRARREVIEVLIYATLCAWLLSQQIRRCVAGAVKDMRWSNLFCRHASRFLEVILRGSEYLELKLGEMLRRSARDPNRRRRSDQRQLKIPVNDN